MANEPVFSPVPADAVYVPETPIETPVEVTPEVTPAVVTDETPAAEPILETPVEVAPTTVEVIKEVEKIIEKYPEMDEYSREILDALISGDDSPILNYLSEKHRDYKKMSDYDAVKADLLKKNPHYSDEDAALKIEMQYGEVVKIDLNQLDPESEEYLTAVAHNKTVERNQKLLKLDAVEARNALESAKKEIKLPKIKQEVVPENVPTPESIEQGRRDWQANVAKEIPNLQEFTYKVGDEDVTYKVSDAERKAELEFFNDLDFNKLVGRLGWIDKDGKQNIQKMAGDVLKMEKMPTLISNAYTQGKTAGTKSTVADIKNLDLSQTNSQAVPTQPADIGLLGFAHLNPK